jgi:hypothetical protein
MVFHDDPAGVSPGSARKITFCSLGQRANLENDSITTNQSVLNEIDLVTWLDFWSEPERAEPITAVTLDGCAFLTGIVDLGFGGRDEDIYVLAPHN